MGTTKKIDSRFVFLLEGNVNDNDLGWWGPANKTWGESLSIHKWIMIDGAKYFCTKTNEYYVSL